jgi:hypothetical protein
MAHGDMKKEIGLSNKWQQDVSLKYLISYCLIYIQGN